MSILSISCYLLLFGVLFLSRATHAQQQQSIRFWSSSATCTGNPDVTHADPSNTYPIGSATTAYLQINGLWGFELCNPTICQVPVILSGSGSACVPYSFGTGTSRLVTTRYGDADQSEVKLTLFGETSFRGEPTEISAAGVSLPSPTTFRSYFFSGQNEWAWDSSTTGGNACLNHTLTDGATYGLSYAVTTNLEQVTSFELGCGNIDPTRTTIQPSTVSTPGSTTTPDPDLFSCENKPDGFYPHPTDCSMWIGCRAGLPIYFSCPDGLLYNPETGVCDDPDQVDCGGGDDISCIGLVDGAYPHPRSCAAYILCRSEVATVATCPPPLLFDKILRVCNYPDAVVC